MAPIMIDLNPNRQLLNSNFDGYKLSIQEIPCKRKEFLKTVDRVFLSSKQYSLLHAKLFGLHNYLISDSYDENESVYFIDTELNVSKIYMDPICNELVDPINVWKIPIVRERTPGDYNAYMKFVSDGIGVIGDGAGTLYIVDTGSRNNDDSFTQLFAEEVVGHDEPFLLIDAYLRSKETEIKELHVLLSSIKQDCENERFSTILHWVVLNKVDDVWRQISIRQLKSSGYIDYAYLDRNGEHVYVVTDGECKVILNSDFPVDKTEFDKLYKWSQTIEDVTIKIPLVVDAEKTLINVLPEKTKICVKYNEQVLIYNDLHQKIDSNMTTWTLEQDMLVIVLNKEECGLMWPNLFIGDDKGEYELDTCIDDNSKSTNDTETNQPSGITFNSQQVEECDFESDRSTTFGRFSGVTNKPTHRANLGSHQVLLKVYLQNDQAPALGIRHDVDICVWQPQGNGDEFSLVHEGTLLALGYVQASKQNRKFISCPPDMSYSVICESSGHLFIYRQCIEVSSGEVRNRSTGRRINNIAQQQVVNISADEILGIHCTKTSIFLLTEKDVRLLILSD